jgi:hypothetical protein
MAIPGVDVGLVHKLFTALETLKTIAVDRIGGVVEQGTAAGNQGQDALQGILNDFQHHHGQSLELLTKITGVKPPAAR